MCTATHKTKSMFFFLAQTEQGDVFKITLEVDEDSVTEIKLKYFDTAPVCSSFVVLKTGFLFLASEFGNHYLYQIAHLGEDDDEPEFSSAMPLDEGETFFFQPRPLKNLVLVDEMESLAPILHCNITDLANEDTPQLYSVCGRGPRSTLRVLRHGLEVSEMAVSDLPGSPNAVWTVRKSIHEEYDSYIIVSFVNATLVLSIGETVEEVTDSGFLGTTPTLSCSSIGNDALLQIYPDGIRHIRSDRRINEWKTPGKKYIVKCAVNQRQVVIALTGGELVYFEMDQTGQLNEYTERKDMNSEVICMALPRVPPGEQRARFLAVGLADETVRIISLDTSDCLSPLSTQALPARPESLCIVEMGQQEEGGTNSSTMFLNIGLSIGVLTRTVMDTVTGELSDTRTRYLGTRAVKLFRIPVHGVDAVLAISSRTWLSYFYQSRFHLSPLSYDTLEYACGFSSEQCTQGVVAISTNTLRILALEKLGAVFNQVTMPLKYTPRKFVIDEESSNMILIETDHNTFTENSKNQRKQQIAEEMVETADDESKMEAAKLAEQFLSEDLPEEIFSSPKAGNGMWASQIRILSPIKQETLEIIKFEQNEAAFSVCICQFNNSPVPGLTYVVVGTSRDLSLAPRQCSGGFLYTYRLVDDGSHMELVHKTPVDDVPTALCPFQGRLLVGVGKLLRIYDLGKKKLLRKCENKHIPNLIVGIKCSGNRILASDNQESIHFVKYKAGENSLVAFADDTFPRWVTQATMLDYYTAAVGDKFGNLAVLRLPQDSKDNVEDDPTGNKAIWDRGLLNGASQKLDMINMFHIGESVTYLELATLIPGGNEALVYTTLSGTIGMFVPFTSREDIDFFQHLEMHMRNEAPPLCGRDHLSYRSSYIPVKATIDGDLCEQYNSLEPSKRKAIADELDRSPSEVSKKLEDMRTTYAF